MFRTELSVAPFPFSLNHSSKVITIGSCFSDVIGNKLKDSKIETEVNPFGTIFNPLSIFQRIEDSSKNDFSGQEDYVESNGVWFNYQLHSSFYASSKEALVKDSVAAIDKVHKKLSQLDCLIITFGTAFGYKKNNSGKIVSNCHKQPSSLFKKYLMTVEEVVTGFKKMTETLQNKNKNLQIIITVSPVRHTKDSLVLNSVSKSTLRLAAHECSSTLSNVHYFPAYEIMMDDLRDYRFYKEDMIHPTEVAENYIWERFSSSIFRQETIALIKDWESLSKAIQHKPFREGTMEYKKFLAETLKKAELLSTKLKIQQEIELLRGKLT